MYDYEQAIEDKKFKIKDYILWPFAGLGFIFLLSLILQKGEDYSFVTADFLAAKGLREAYLQQATIILVTILIVAILYSQVIIRLEKNEKIPPALVDLIFLILCVLPIFISLHILGIAQSLNPDIPRKTITILVTIILLRLMRIYKQVKITRKINQRLKKTGN